jgi:amino acid permease
MQLIPSLYLGYCNDVQVPVPSSFHGVAGIAIPKFSLLIDVAVAMKCLGITTSYLIVIGDSLPVALQQLGLADYNLTVKT